MTEDKEDDQTPEDCGASDSHCSGARRTHELKTWPAYFQPILDGVKRFEGRRDDRDFRVGDYLRLREWDEHKGIYTGRELTVWVSYKLDGGQFGIESGWCVLSIRWDDQRTQG